MISLFDHQALAIQQLKTGSILCGGVGSGKSITAIAYFYNKECKGDIPLGDHKEFSHMKKPKDLYIITTARKRDSLDWEKECALFMLSKKRDSSMDGVKVTVDSWNNIKNYIDIENAFFVFDEQRLVGSGAWVKAFIKITKKNNWILLSATPGDTWMDYVPVFVANGFYKNRTEFLRRHVVYNNFTKFPKVDHYVELPLLRKLKEDITVVMSFDRSTTSHMIDVDVEFDTEKFNQVAVKRWNPFKEEPIRDVAELGHIVRKVVNSDRSRLDQIVLLTEKNPKIIVFYNYDYELEILRGLDTLLGIPVAEYNGHKHEPIPKTKRWIYLVQYISGSEAWNCIETDTIVFYSLNYSYRLMTQAAGRIDRLNTKFKDLYYYRLRSFSLIDQAILRALKNKKEFNEADFLNKTFNWAYT